MNYTIVPRLAGALAVMLPLAQAVADTSLQSRYQADRQACMQRDGASRQACLREAGAALHEARQGRLAPETTDATSWQHNAAERCAAHRNAVDRSACERIARGEGRSSHSVQGGGVIRQIEVEIPAGGTVVSPAPPAGHVPAPASSGAYAPAR